MFLVEFFTKPLNDRHRVIFTGPPSKKDIEDYIANNDWLTVEYEENTLEWVIDLLDVVQNHTPIYNETGMNV